jgi:hypothetical protein
VVGEHVARANDHWRAIIASKSPGGNWSELKPSIKRNSSRLDRHFAFAVSFRDHALVQAWRGCKEKIIFCKRSNLPKEINRNDHRRD